MVLLARKTGYCGDDALVLAVQANGMQLQQTVCARLGKIGQVVKEIFYRLVAKDIRNALRCKTGGFLPKEGLQ